MILTDPLELGECAGIVKEIQGVKAIVTPRQFTLWISPWLVSVSHFSRGTTSWVWEFVPAEFIKTISVCNVDDGQGNSRLVTTVDTQVVLERELMYFWSFIRKDITGVA